MAANKKTRKKKSSKCHKARSMELFAIHQYMNQHYNLSDKDYGELANMKLIAVTEIATPKTPSASRNWAANHGPERRQRERRPGCAHHL